MDRQQNGSRQTSSPWLDSIAEGDYDDFDEIFASRVIAAGELVISEQALTHIEEHILKVKDRVKYYHEQDQTLTHLEDISRMLRALRVSAEVP